MKVVTTLLVASLVAASGCDSDTNEPLITSTVETFASRLQEKGSAWRSVNVTKAGDVKMQLVSLTQTDAKMNLGIGTISGTQCVIAASVDTVANGAEVAPQLTRTVATGTYCVRLADIGNLTQLVDFSVRIEKPF
jgi:hypothetical protein